MSTLKTPPSDPESQPTTGESQILTPTDASNLRKEGLLGDGEDTGYRRLRIHKRRLNNLSEEEHRHIPLNSPISPSPSDDAFATIPENLISRETLLHVGLSENKATELWHRWTNWPASGPRRETDVDDGGLQVTFIDYILGAFENQVDTAEDDDAIWNACMSTCGIDVTVQVAIMDPAFKYLRLSNSCLHWARDTIEMRYAGLKEIQRTSRERDTQIRRAASRPGGHEGGERSGGPSGGFKSATGSSSFQSVGQGERIVFGEQRQDAPGIGPNLDAPLSSFAAPDAPGYTALFKGIDQPHIAGLFDNAEALARIQCLLSSAPSDFSGTRALFYFTPDYKVAEYDAAYSKRRANCESVVIVCLQIPNAAIESMSAPEIQRLYWPHPEWKELVWRCRTQQKLPSHLRKYRQALLIIGSISRKSNSVYHNLASWEEVTEKHMLRVGGAAGHSGPAAVQYAFSGEEEGHEYLVEHAAQNIEITAYTTADLDKWLTKHTEFN